DDLPVLYQLAEEEGSADARDEADGELKALHTDIEAAEVRTLLSGEYDEREALVNIRAGAGGVDAADWAEMLMRMYIRWAEQHKYGVEGFDTSYAEVEVLPVVETTDHIDIPEGDVRVDVYRSSGPGGQSVNTTDSAVRLT